MSSATVGTLAVKLAAITGEWDRDLKKAAGSLKRVTAAAKEVATVSGVAFAAMAAGIYKAVQASSEQLKVERKLQAAFRATGNTLDLDRFNAFASGIQRVTTTGDEAVMSMGAMMGSMGLSQRAIEALIPGVLDLAASTGQSSDAIAKQLSVAVQTGVGRLREYGIALTANETALFRSGTEAERTALLVSKLAGFQGQAAAEASTATGKAAQLANAFGDLQESFGAMLESPVADILDAAKRALEGMKGAIDGLSPATKEWVGRIIIGATAVAGLTAAIAGVVALAPAVVGAFAAVKIAITGALIPALPMIAALAAGIAGIILIVGSLRMLWREYGAELKQMWGDVTAYMIQTWGTLSDAIVDGFRSAFAWITDKLQRFNQFFSDTVITYIGMISGKSADEVGAQMMAANAGGGLLSLDGAGGAASGALAKLAEVADAVRSGAADVWSGLKGWGVQAGAELKGIGQVFGEGLGAIVSLMPSLGADPATPATLTGLAPGGSGGTSASAGAASGGLAARLDGIIDNYVSELEAEHAREIQMREEQTAKLASSLGGIGQDLLGAASSEISSVVSAGMQGGPVIAAATFVSGLLQKTRGFEEIAAFLSDLMGQLSTALEPITQALQPLAGTFGRLALILVEVFAPVIEIFAMQLELVGRAAAGIGWVIGKIALGIMTVWNEMVDLAIQAAKWVDNMPFFDMGATIRSLENMRANTDSMNDAIDQLGDIATGSFDGIASLGDAALDTADALAATVGVLNAPEGFKVEAARFRAAIADARDPTSAVGSSPSGPPSMGDIGDPGRSSIVVQNMTVQAADPVALASEVRRIEQVNQFNTTGSLSAGTLRSRVTP